MLKCITIYSKYFAAPLSIVLDEIAKFIDFEALKPDNLALLFGLTDELD